MLPPERDEDIPSEVKQELMRCAVSLGHISYYYLCDVWRRGKIAGESNTGKHRCTFCDYRWEGTPGAEHCGDCHRAWFEVKKTLGATGTVQ